MKEPAPPRSDGEAKIQLLASLEVFASLSADELSQVAGHSRWLSVPEGATLFAGGEAGGRLYAIREGEVLISRQGDEGREISLATFVAGEAFGELNLFDRQADGTTARCERQSFLLLFPADQGTEAADRFFAAHPGIRAKVLHSLLAVVARRIRSTNRLIAEKSPWVQELRRQVSLDKLTSLYNATFLEEDLVKMVEEEHRQVCLLMLKPDNFKVVNDSFGHQAGDRVLQLMAAELRARLGGIGTPVRYRGDVLAAVLPETGLQAARRHAEQVRRSMSALDLSEITGGQALRLTVSLGVAGSSRPGGADTAEEGAGSDGATDRAAALVERAYENLFTARNRGGDRVCAARTAKREARQGPATSQGKGHAESG